MFLRQLNFGVLSVWQLFYVSCKRKSQFLFQLYLLLLLSEREVEPWKLLATLQFAMRALVVYKLVSYKKSKCSKSITFSASRLANVEEFFDVNIFLNVNIFIFQFHFSYSFKYVCVVYSLKIFLLRHLFCNVEFEFSWFHKTKPVIRDFNS